MHSGCLFKASVLLCLAARGVHGFSILAKSYATPTTLFAESTPKASEESVISPTYELRSYQHDVATGEEKTRTFTISYRYQSPTGTGAESPSLILLHPAGIGLSSWFWERTMASFSGCVNAPAIYAVNLLGCGASEGSDAWDVEECGPITDRLPEMWIEAVETLMKKHIFSSDRTIGSSPIGQTSKRTLPKSVSIMTQGALAPVGILLAQRNPDTVSHLIMASPPVWKDLTVPTTPKAIRRGVKFFESPRWGRLAFRSLETRRAIRLFSNLFLFIERCDETWLARAMNEASEAVRPPIVAVNSGALTQVSFEDALRNMKQPVLLLVGEADDKARPRPEFVENIPSCEHALLPGRNVLPWESPDDVAARILDTCFKDKAQ